MNPPVPRSELSATPYKPPVALSRRDYVNRDLDLVSVRVCGLWRPDPIRDFLINRETTDINGNPRQ